MALWTLFRSYEPLGGGGGCLYGIQYGRALLRRLSIRCCVLLQYNGKIPHICIWKSSLIAILNAFPIKKSWFFFTHCIPSIFLSEKMILVAPTTQVVNQECQKYKQSISSVAPYPLTPVIMKCKILVFRLWNVVLFNGNIGLGTRQCRVLKCIPSLNKTYDRLGNYPRKFDHCPGRRPNSYNRMLEDKYPIIL